MPQTDIVGEPSFEGLVGEFFPQDEKGLQRVLIDKGEAPLKEIAGMDSASARKKAHGANGEIYSWSIDDMVDPRIARKFIQTGTKPARDKYVFYGTYGMHREPFITRREDGFQRGRTTKKLDAHVETDKNKLDERRERIAESIDNRMAGLVSGSYHNPPEGTVDYEHMFGKGINRRTNRHGTSKSYKRIHGAKSYAAFAAELDKNYDRFVKHIRRLYDNPGKRDLALKLVKTNASRVGLKQYVELADIVRGDLDLTQKPEDAYYGWEGSIRREIQDYLKKTVPRGTESHVTLYEFGKAADSYRMGKGFNFGNEDLPKDVNGRMEIRFRQGKSYFGISVQLEQNPLTDEDKRHGRTLKDMGYSLAIKPL